MYKSGQHLTEKVDTTPLKINLDFLEPGYENLIDEDVGKEDKGQPETENFDYNIFME